MQQFRVKLKNVPIDTSLVCSSTNSQLNKEETLSVENDLKDGKLALNNPEVTQVQHTGRSIKAIVCVISKSGLPLMPCSFAKSKRMVKSGKAKIIRRFPCTVQLNFECKNQVQEVVLGIDTGYGNIGFSAITDKKELISGTLKLDGRTKERLDNKRMYRRLKRSKLWYREPRFMNRKKPEGWLPPSIERRYQTHINLVNRIKQLLPINKIVVEVAKFDIQKIENPEISGTDYQQGSLYNYQNIRSYLMAREHGKCQLCGKDFKGQPSHVHHIKPKGEQGADKPDNLVLLHKKCHKDLHEKHLEHKLKSNSKSYKQSTFMSIINKRFWKDIPNLEITYGNITFVNRNKLRLPKTHYNDAFVIANGSNQERIKPIEIIQKHRNNRVLQRNRKGYKPSIRRRRYPIQPLDLFWIGNKQYICKGMFSYGKQVLCRNIKKKERVKYSDITKIFNFGGLVLNNIKSHNTRLRE